MGYINELSARRMHTLKPGIYNILNDEKPDIAIDLSGHDMKSVIAYGSHGGENQKWCIERLGAGYSIRCIFNDAFITLDSGISEGCTMVATPYPVSWEIEPDDFEAGIYRIRWPGSSFVFDLPGGTGHTIQLSNRYPFKPTRLWRFIHLKTNEFPHVSSQNDTKADLEFTSNVPKKIEPSPVITSVDTVIDAEGLKLGGNGELSITTTTTTVTTSVTKVKRVAPP